MSIHFCITTFKQKYFYLPNISEEKQSLGELKVYKSHSQELIACFLPPECDP